MKKEDVVCGVKQQAIWWLNTRLSKVQDEKHDTMEVNPFMAPLIAALHGHKNFDELAEFLIVGHFAIGHATGFGKLVDEKILPNVFGTKKLDKATRNANPVLKKTCFDNVDHIVSRTNEKVLLSQKASRWTIQLGQAVELNKSFQEILELRENNIYQFDKIIVATFYGKPEELSDKYRILRGITTGAAHDVVDITKDVSVLSGKEFWAWIGGNDETQKWVMEGITQAIHAKKDDLQEVLKLLKDFRTSFSSRYKDAIVNGEIDWEKFLFTVNGE